MLPRNIDLTEHRDFSGGGGIFMDTPIEIPLDEYQLMTCGEYERLRWWESIFGRKRHRNRKEYVFEYERKHRNEERTHCWRCGKEFRLPWDRVNGICRKCDSEVSEESGNRWRIPWVEHYGQISPVDNTAYDLFNRR